MKKKNNKMHKNNTGAQDNVKQNKLAESHREAALELLRQSEEKYRAILENIEDGYYEVDLAGNLTFFNDTVCKLLGYTRKELMGMNSRQYTDKENSKKLIKAFNKVNNTGKPTKGLDWKIIRKDGTKRYIEASVSLLKNSSSKPTGYRGIIRDITERKKIEGKLRNEEQRFRALADQSSDIILLVNRKGIITYENPAVEVLGIKAEERIGASSFDNVHPDDLKFKKYEFNNLFKDINASLLRSEIRLHHRDGSWLTFEVMASGLSRGNIVESVIVNLRNITERKLAEMALKKSEERYRSVFENTGLPIVIMENSLLIFMVNERFVEMSEYEKDNIEGLMKFTDFIASGDRDNLLESFSRRKGDKPVEYECQIAHRNGKRFDVLIRLGHIPGADQFIASFTDITSRKQAEVALLENQEHLQKENIRLRSSIRERYRFCDIIGKSQVMQEVYEFILQAAATQANVIIYGESGTGKELVAKAIHETSDRSQKGFITVHCGAIPETLMESSFFGYKKGAFTGANLDKRGYLDEAYGGTMFLDEAGEICLNMQVKLLRAISGDGYTPVGSNTIKNTGVRIIAATNRNLRDLVKRGVMREDFFYRIHILPIYLPPLRQRKDDLPLLIDYFLQLHDKNQPPLPANIAEALLNYVWPGNIRELQNVLHRYLTLKRLDFAGGPITMPAGLEGSAPKDLDSIRKDFAVSTMHYGQAHSAQDHENMHRDPL